MLTPLAVGPGQPFPYISGLSLSLGLIVRDPEAGEERFARVKVPEGLDRFVAVGDRGLLVPLEDVIGHFLSRLFPEMEVAERASFRLTRDGDTEISTTPTTCSRPSSRSAQAPVRRCRAHGGVELDLARDARGLQESLGTADQVYPINGMLDLADVGQLYALDRPDLKYAPWVPFTQRRLVDGRAGDLFAEIAHRDLLVHHPYDSFGTSVEAFVRAAASDEQVVTVKTTVYRTSEDSAIAPALIQASRTASRRSASSS